MTKKFYNPEGIHKPFGYSHVGEVTSGKLVLISGQVALDKDGNVVGDDYTTQTRQVFENLKEALKAAGGTMDDIVKLNYYILDPSHLPEIREVRNTFLNKDSMPVSTAIGVARLFRPEILIEVEAVAVVK